MGNPLTDFANGIASAVNAATSAVGEAISLLTDPKKRWGGISKEQLAKITAPQSVKPKQPPAPQTGAKPVGGMSVARVEPTSPPSWAKPSPLDEYVAQHSIAQQTKAVASANRKLIERAKQSARALQQEREQLLHMREHLQKAQPSPDEVKEFNRKVEEYNQKVAEYNRTVSAIHANEYIIDRNLAQVGGVSTAPPRGEPPMTLTAGKPQDMGDVYAQHAAKSSPVDKAIAAAAGGTKITTREAKRFADEYTKTVSPVVEKMLETAFPEVAAVALLDKPAVDTLAQKVTRAGLMTYGAVSVAPGAYAGALYGALQSGKEGVMPLESPRMAQMVNTFNLMAALGAGAAKEAYDIATQPISARVAGPLTVSKIESMEISPVSQTDDVTRAMVKSVTKHDWLKIEYEMASGERITVPYTGNITSEFTGHLITTRGVAPETSVIGFARMRGTIKALKKPPLLQIPKEITINKISPVADVSRVIPEEVFATGKKLPTRVVAKIESTTGTGKFLRVGEDIVGEFYPDGEVPTIFKGRAKINVEDMFKDTRKPQLEIETHGKITPAENGVAVIRSRTTGYAKLPASTGKAEQLQGTLRVKSLSVVKTQKFPVVNTRDIERGWSIYAKVEKPQIESTFVGKVSTPRGERSVLLKIHAKPQAVYEIAAEQYAIFKPSIVDKLVEDIRQPIRLMRPREIHVVHGIEDTRQIAVVGKTAGVDVIIGEVRSPRIEGDFAYYIERKLSNLKDTGARVILGGATSRSNGGTVEAQKMLGVVGKPKPPAVEQTLQRMARDITTSASKASVMRVAATPPRVSLKTIARERVMLAPTRYVPVARSGQAKTITAPQSKLIQKIAPIPRVNVSQFLRVRPVQYIAIPREVTRTIPRTITQTLTRERTRVGVGSISRTIQKQLENTQTLEMLTPISIAKALTREQETEKAITTAISRTITKTQEITRTKTLTKSTSITLPKLFTMPPITIIKPPTLPPTNFVPMFKIKLPKIYIGGDVGGIPFMGRSSPARVRGTPLWHVQPTLAITDALLRGKPGRVHTPVSPQVTRAFKQWFLSGAIGAFNPFKVIKTRKKRGGGNK